MCAAQGRKPILNFHHDQQISAVMYSHQGQDKKEEKKESKESKDAKARKANFQTLLAWQYLANTIQKSNASDDIAVAYTKMQAKCMTWRVRRILYRVAASLHVGQTWPAPFVDRLVQAEAEEARQFRAEDLTH